MNKQDRKKEYRGIAAIIIIIILAVVLIYYHLHHSYTSDGSIKPSIPVEAPSPPADNSGVP